MNIIIVILVFNFLIFIHELGHFLAARRCGVAVEEFSLGIPPKIITKKIKETVYILSLLPIGGYVKIKGFMQDENPKDISNYAAKNAWQKFTIIFAGPLFNIILTFLLLIIVFWMGLQRSAIYSAEPFLATPAPNSIAAKAGLQKGDLILNVGDQKIQKWSDLDRAMVDYIGADKLFLSVQRNSKLLTFELPAPKVGVSFGLFPILDPIVGKILPNSAAEKIGLKDGDRILSINDETVTEWEDIGRILNENGAAEGYLLFERNGAKNEIKFFSQLSPETNRWVLGIAVPTIVIKHSLLESLQLSLTSIIDNVTTTFTFLAKLITGRSSSEVLGGPVMIASVISSSANSGIITLLYITALISLQLAIFNLLPIPALDGGHLLLLLIEKIKGKELTLDFKRKFQTVGFILLLSLVIFVTTQDIFRFF